jgi:hypothetical protein
MLHIRYYCYKTNVFLGEEKIKPKDLLNRKFNNSSFYAIHAPSLKSSKIFIFTYHDIQFYKTKDKSYHISWNMKNKYLVCLRKKLNLPLPF